MVKVNDQIVEVDGRSLHGYTNQEAVEMLRSTGNIVRYHGHIHSLPLDDKYRFCFWNFLWVIGLFFFTGRPCFQVSTQFGH
jgi:hypothetical protein